MLENTNQKNSTFEHFLNSDNRIICHAAVDVMHTLDNNPQTHPHYFQKEFNLLKEDIIVR